MMSIYKSLGKVLYFVAYPLLQLFKSHLSGKRVRIQVVTKTGKVLLVRTWFGRQRWSLPGGGIEKGESPVEAAIRELREETAIEADTEQLTLIGEMQHSEDIPFPLIVFRLRLSIEQLEALPRGRKFEIIDRSWWSIDDLPQEISPVVRWSLKCEH